MTCERGGEVNVLEDRIPASRTSRRACFLVKIHPTYMLRLRRTRSKEEIAPVGVLSELESVVPWNWREDSR